MAKKKTAIQAIEDLAAMTEREFGEVRQRFDGVDKRLDGLDGRFDGVDKRLDNLEKDAKGLDRKFDAMWYELKEIKKRLENVADRNELEALKERVKHLEIRFAAATRKNNPRG